MQLSILSSTISSTHYISILNETYITFKNASNCLSINIYSYLEKYGGQSSNLHLNGVHFFNTSVN